MSKNGTSRIRQLQFPPRRHHTLLAPGRLMPLKQQTTLTQINCVTRLPASGEFEMQIIPDDNETEDRSRAKRLKTSNSLSLSDSEASALLKHNAATTHPATSSITATQESKGSYLAAQGSHNESSPQIPTDTKSKRRARRHSLSPQSANSRFGKPQEKDQALETVIEDSYASAETQQDDLCFIAVASPRTPAEEQRAESRARLRRRTTSVETSHPCTPTGIGASSQIQFKVPRVEIPDSDEDSNGSEWPEDGSLNRSANLNACNAKSLQEPRQGEIRTAFRSSQATTVGSPPKSSPRRATSGFGTKPPRRDEAKSPSSQSSSDLRQDLTFALDSSPTNSTQARRTRLFAEWQALTDSQLLPDSILNFTLPSQISD